MPSRRPRAPVPPRLGRGLVLPSRRFQTRVPTPPE